MSWIAPAIMAGTGVLSLGSSLMQGNASEDAIDDQADAARRLSKISKEQWNIYKESIFPLEQQAREMGVTAQELALQRGQTDAKLYEDFYAPLQEKYVTSASEGIKPQYEQVAREAAKTVNEQFDTQAGAVQRNLERHGVSPTSGQYTTTGDRMALARAAAGADAQNTARMNERNRVEDVNFNRMGVALGRQPSYSAPSQSVSGANFPGMSGLAQAGNIYGQQAATYGQGAVNTMAGGLNLIQQGADLYNSFRTPTPTQPAQQGNYNLSQPSTNGVNAIGTPTGWHDGGLVRDNYNEGGQVIGRQGGQVQGPPGIDQVPAALIGRDGSAAPAAIEANEYVIPADVVMRKGTDFFDKLIASGRKQ